MRRLTTNGAPTSTRIGTARARRPKDGTSETMDAAWAQTRRTDAGELQHPRIESVGTHHSDYTNDCLRRN